MRSTTDPDLCAETPAAETPAAEQRSSVEVPTAEQSPTVSVEKAGAACGLGRSASYEAARRGDLPTIRFGRRIVVPTAALRRLLQLDGT